MSAKAPAGAEDGSKKASLQLKFKTSVAVFLYCLCSSSMLVINKVCVHLIPAPSFVLLSQLLASCIAVQSLHVVNGVDAGKFERAKMVSFMPVALAFTAAIFTNIKTLQYANVETFIVVRSSTPLIISLCDWLFLGRELPTRRSVLSLVFIVLGATAYVLTDKYLEVRAYAWVSLWMIVFVFDQVYIKFVCDTVPMSTWERVFYTNFLSLVPVVVLCLLQRESEVVADLEWTLAQTGILLTSCICGVAMSYSSFLLRGLVSATFFTVVGVLCKIGSVVINCLIWDKHASSTGLLALMVCLAAGTAYEQSPMRKGVGAHQSA